MSKLRYAVIVVLLLASINLVVACTVVNSPSSAQDICMLMKKLAPSLVLRN